MWYLIIGLAFVSLGVGLAIWVARERKAKNKALLKVAKLEQERDKYGEIAKDNEKACATLEEDLGRLEDVNKELKGKITQLREKMLDAADVEDVRGILNDSMKEETF